MDSATAPPPPSEHQHEHERLLDKMAHASIGAFDDLESQAPSQPQSKPPSESEESILDKLASAFTHQNQNQNQNQKPKPGSQQSQSLDPRRHSHSPYVASAVPGSKAAYAARDGGAAEADVEVAYHGPGVLEKLGFGAEQSKHAPPVPNGSPPRRHNVLDHLGLGLDHHGDEQPLPHHSVLETWGLGAKHQDPAHAPPLPVALTPASHHNVLDHLGLGVDHHADLVAPPPRPQEHHGVLEKLGLGAVTAPPVAASSSTIHAHHNVLDDLGLGLDHHDRELAPQPQHHSLLEKLRLEHPPTSTSHDHAGVLEKLGLKQPSPPPPPQPQHLGFLDKLGRLESSDDKGHHGGGVVHKLEEALHLDEDSEEDASTRKQRHNGDAGGLVRKISGALGLDGRLAIGHPKDESSMLDKATEFVHDRQLGCKEPRTPYEEAVDAMKKELKNVEHRLDRS